MMATTIHGEGSVRTEHGQNSKIVDVDDFNGDGKADILWRYSSTGENYVYLMNGTTITGEGYLTQADLNWQVQNASEVADAVRRANKCTLSDYCVSKDGEIYRHTNNHECL